MRETEVDVCEAAAAETLGGGEIPVIFTLPPVEICTDLRSDVPDRRDGSARVIGKELGTKDFELDLSVGDRLFAALSLSCCVKLDELWIPNKMLGPAGVREVFSFGRRRPSGVRGTAGGETGRCEDICPEDGDSDID
jgi:hypothetical protein